MSERIQTPTSLSTDTPAPEESPSPTTSATKTPTTAKGSRFGKKTKITMIAVGSLCGILLVGFVLNSVFGGSGIVAQAENAAVAEGTPPSRRYIARVNNELLTWNEVAEEAMLRYGPEVLDQIINRKIVQQACQARGIQVTNAEVNNEVLKISGKFKMPVETWYQMLKTERNMSPMQYRRDIIWPMLALKKLAGERISVSQDDMKKAFIRDFGAKVKAKVIMLDSNRRAIEVYEQIRRNPADFEKLARQHSIEPNSRALDGAIPPIHRFYSNEKLEKVAFSLKENEISGIVQIGVDRYIIMKCEGQTEPIVTDMKHVQEELYERLQEERLQEAIAKVFDKLRKDARVDNYLTNTSTKTIQQTSGADLSGQTKPAAFDTGATKR